MDRAGVFAVVRRFARRQYALWLVISAAWAATPALRAADCNGNGIDDALDLEPRSTTLSIAAAYGVGVTPRSIVAVDVDHDGALDLVTADRHSNRLSVLRNVGDGRLEAASSVPVENPASLTAFDADGDGLADLAYVSTLASVARVRRGSLAGGFLSPEEHSLGGQGSVFVTSGDVDLDGKADIVTLNRFENRMTVLFGEGGGAFAAPVVAGLLPDGDPLAAALLDLEGDRDLDIAVAAAGVSQGGGATAGGTALVGNLGARTFDAPRSLGGLNPVWVAAADLEGDGDHDLIVAEGTGGTRLSGALVTAANDGKGRLSLRVVAGRDGPSSSFHFVAAADLGGDGRPEALVLTSAREVIAYTNGGQGQLHPAPRGGTAVLGSVPRVAATADLDGDGAVELAVATHEDDHTRNGVTVLRRELAAASRDEDGNGVPDECEEDCDGNGALDPLEIARGEAADCNRNGRPDACDFTATEPRLQETLLLDPGPRGTMRPGRLLVEDFTGDRQADILFGVLGSQLMLFRGQGNGTFVPPAPGDGGSAFPEDTVAGDLDGDGNMDIASSMVWGPLRLQLGDGNGAVAAAVEVDLDPPTPAHSLSLADLEGDGDLDLAAITDLEDGCSGDGFLLVRNDGGFRSWRVERRRSGVCNLVRMTATDMTGDGLLDLVGAAIGTTPKIPLTSALLVVAPGTAGGRQGPVSTYLAGPPAVLSALAMGDVDGDGDRDAVLGFTIEPWDRAQGLRVLANDRQAGFRLQGVNRFEKGIAALSVRDLDGDGRDEVVAAVARQEAVKVWPGNGRLVYSVPTTGNPFALAAADLDADAVPELVTASVGGPHPAGFQLTVLQAVETPVVSDCNHNGTPDACDIDSGSAADCDDDGLLDECELGPDVNRNGIPDSCDAPGFNLSFEGPGQLTGNPGATLKATYDCVMTPVGAFVGNGDGAQGWSIGAWVDGLRVTGASVAGTIAADRAPGSPGIAYGGFEITELASDGARLGFISAVILSSVEPIALPTDRPSVICRVAVEGEAPGLAEPREARLMYADGLRGRGNPVQNSVTREGATKIPFLLPLHVSVTGQPPAFRRGDANADGRLDISDSMRLVTHLFLGAEAPACLKAADADDSGAVDLADALFTNLYLFAGQGPPPAPGPAACGEDPTPDAVSCLEYAACE